MDIQWETGSSHDRAPDYNHYQKVPAEWNAIPESCPKSEKDEVSTSNGKTEKGSSPCNFWISLYSFFRRLIAKKMKLAQGIEPVLLATMIRW